MLQRRPRGRYLFAEHRVTLTPLDLATSAPLLLLFLAVVLVLLPIYGQLRPREVPFLAAFRPYAGTGRAKSGPWRSRCSSRLLEPSYTRAGNWRFTWHVVARGARHKLGRLRTLEGVEVGESARVMWPDNPHFCEQAMRAP